MVFSLYLREPPSVWFLFLPSLYSIRCYMKLHFNLRLKQKKYMTVHILWQKYDNGTYIWQEKKILNNNNVCVEGLFPQIVSFLLILLPVPLVLVDHTAFFLTGDNGSAFCSTKAALVYSNPSLRTSTYINTWKKGQEPPHLSFFFFFFKPCCL